MPDAGHYRNKRALATLGLGTAALFVLGLMYAWSLYADFLDLGRAESSFVFSTALCLFCVGSLLAARITARFTVRATVAVSAALLLIGFLCLAFFAKCAFWVPWMSFGLLFGTSCGIGYNAIVTSVNGWYPGRSGFASGILLLGFGLSALLLGEATHLSLDAFGWHATFCVLAVGGAAVLLVYAFWYRPPTRRASPKEQAKQKAAFNFRDYLKADLLLFYFWRIIVLGGCITLVGASSSEALLLGASPLTASLLVGFVATSNGASRIVTGLVFDRTNIRVVMVLTTSLALASLACITLAFLFGNLPLFIGAAVAVGFAYGSLPVISATYSRVRFGEAEYATGLAILNSNVAFGSFLSMAFVAAFGTGADRFALYAALFVAAVVAALFLLAFLAKSRQA